MTRGPVPRPALATTVAAQVDPNFDKANQLKLAECYDRLRKVLGRGGRCRTPFAPKADAHLAARWHATAALVQTDEAKAWVGRALAQPVANADDAQAHKDAVQLAKKLGVPVPAAA